MASIEIDGLDESVYQALQSKAAIDHRTVSEEVVAILQRHFANAPLDLAKANETFLDLVGSWQDNRSAEEIVADIRNARRSTQRFGSDAHVLDLSC